MALGLRGRDAERAVLDQLLDEARHGQSRVLVLRGEAGVGKTALLDYVHERASGFCVVRAAGVESEMELAFAGLHQLCVPVLSNLERLPDPQRGALNTAFGLVAGEAVDRFIVSLAVLGLLSEVAEQQPLLCVVDDAQWLDHASAQALAFVARRVLADSVAMVFAVREPTDEEALVGLPELVVPGLRDADAHALLDSVVPGRLKARVRDRIVAETRGNPLALLELPRGLTAAELAGGFGRPDAQPLSSRIEQNFRRQMLTLPAETQRLLVTAAAEPAGDAALLWRAAEQLGIGPDAARPAEAAGLIELDAQVRFRHPLVRAAAYRSATGPDRRDAHRALAEVTDPAIDPARHAWHRAQAATTLDEEVADELERSAAGAASRGGQAAAAAFLARATELTPDPHRRGPRAIAAAQAKLDAAVTGRRHAAARNRGNVPTRRAPASAGRATAGADRVHPLARERRSTADARCGQKTRAAGPRARAGDTSRCARRRDLRRPPRARARPCGDRLRREARHRRPNHRGRSTCSSTAWRPGTPRATSPGSRRSGRPCRPSSIPTTPPPTSSAGCGWRAASRRSCGTTRRGTTSPPARSGSRARPEPSRSSPSR